VFGGGAGFTVSTHIRKSEETLTNVLIVNQLACVTTAKYYYFLMSSTFKRF